MKKILISNSILSSLGNKRGILDRSDFSISLAATGKEALLLHCKNRFDLLVIDIDMKDMGGDELCSMIHKEVDLRGTSILIACDNTPDELDRVSRCGPNACIIKPFKPNHLITKIEQLLVTSSRRGYRVLLRVKINSTDENVTFFCISHNISITGMLIETERVLSQGSLISCAFFLPGSRQIVLDAEVVRSVHIADATYNYGVRFVDIPPECREEIERFVANYPSS